MSKIKRYIKVSFWVLTMPLSVLLWGENYSKQMQQAILLYQEGKNTDAMDRFMDILVTGTPEEKVLASEYISKITQGVSPNAQGKPSDIKVITTESKNIIKQDSEVNKEKTQSKEEMSEEDIVAKKVTDKIKEIKNDILVSIYRKNFIKLYMDPNNERPNYILLKEDKVFNEDMTFKTSVLEDLKSLSGLLITLGKVSITILPNGVVSGNMKIANVRRATILHSYFLSWGLSTTKVKLDIIGSSWQNVISKKIDDFDGIILAIDYEKEPELVVDSETPQAYIAVYPEKIDTSKNQAAIIDFAALMGKNPLASWKMVLNRKLKTSTYAVQKVENTVPTISQIVFNGREKFVGDFYEPGDYEFVLEVSDVKGNTATARKNIYIAGSSQELSAKTVTSNLPKSTTVKTLSKQQVKSNSKSKEIFYKIYFEKNSFKVTKLSQQALDDFVKDLKDYPKSKIIVTGYSYSKEPKPKTSAYKRAIAVKNTLIKKYKIKSSRITALAKVVDFKKTIVEITLK